MKIPESYNGKPLVAFWDYHALNGEIIGHVARYQSDDGKKEIIPFFKTNGAGFAMGIDANSKRPLYGLDRLAHHPRNKAVFIVEGEKSAKAMQSLGCTAITSLGGCQAANKADWIPLSGYEYVYLMPDCDEAGEHYAQTVYAELQALEKPPAVAIIHLPELPAGGDCVDWIQSQVRGWDGYGPIQAAIVEEIRESLAEIIKTAEPVPPEWGLGGLVSDNRSCFDEIEPEPITSELPPVQDLKPDMIPPPFKDWVMDVSHRMQTPPDFVACTALVFVSSLIGAGCSVKPKQKDGWEIVPNLWGGIVARPSVLLKTPCMDACNKILNRMQAEYNRQFEDEKISADFDDLTNEALMDDVKSKIKKAGKGSGRDGVTKADDFEQLRESYRELAQKATEQPTPRILKTNETSVQMMTVLQNQNPRGLLVFRDELNGLLIRWEHPDKQDERAYFLEGFNGNGSFTDAKLSRGITHAKNICLSVFGGLQPDKVRRYLAKTLEGENDGMLQRFMLVFPDVPNPDDWQNVDEYPNRDAQNQVYAIWQTLADMDFTQYGAAFNPEQDDRPYFRFNSQGQAVFNAWLERLQKEKIAREDNPLMLEHLGKYRGLMPSLALIFHLIDLASGQPNTGGISEPAARLAAEWCEYLETHARRVYALCESTETATAALLADKIKSAALPNPFTARDVYRKGWHGMKDSAAVLSALDVLIESGWLMMTRKPTGKLGGRPPAPEYHINPLIFSENA